MLGSGYVSDSYVTQNPPFLDQQATHWLGSKEQRKATVKVDLIKTLGKLSRFWPAEHNEYKMTVCCMPRRPKTRYSELSANGHSRKRTALLMDTVFNSPF